MVYMPRRKKRQFDDIWQKYAARYHEIQVQGIFGAIATEVDDLEKAAPGAPGAEQYIYDQTARRRDEVRRTIQEALDIL